MARCEVCAVPYGETVCVTCGAEVELGVVNLVYEVGSTALVPGMSSIKPMTVREGVQVEPSPCGKCGRMTVSRIENKDGDVGCLECFRDFLLEGPELPPI